MKKKTELDSTGVLLLLDLIQYYVLMLCRTQTDFDKSDDIV